MSTKPCFIYVIGTRDDDGLISGPSKIGITSRPEYRLQGIQTGNPRKVDFYHLFPMGDRESALFLEQQFHRIYSGRKMMGEWYDMHPSEALGNIALQIDVSLFCDPTISKERKAELRESYDLEAIMVKTAPSRSPQ